MPWHVPTIGMEKINSIQIKIIHVAKNQLKIDDDLYRSMLRQWFDAASSKELTYEQASTFINELKKKGFKIKRSGRRLRGIKSPNLIQLASPQELKLIEHLKQDIRWQYHDGFKRWIKRRFGIERIKTRKEAQKIIEGLKAMRNRPWQDKKEA